MKKMRKIKILLFVAFLSIIITSCKEEEPPTKSNMEGVWVAKHVYNSNNQDIISQLEFPIVAFHLSSDGTIISTAGPLIMYIVYGESKYTEIASKIDQVFNYATLSFNGGEFFVGGGVQPRFTLEMKLEGLPGQKALTTLLDLLGVTNDWLDVVVYHKFMDVAIDFSNSYKTMTWRLDSQTAAVYNKKDVYGNYVLWMGWPVNNFQRCEVVFEKSSMDIRDVVTAASK